MNLSKKTLSVLSTIMGFIVAVASAWITIDWSSFDIQRDWPKLILSAVIAIGGVVTQIKGETLPYKYD